MIYNESMKKFRFKYSPLVWVLLAVVLALAVAGLVWNVLNLISCLPLGATKLTINVLLVVINALFLAFVVSVMVYGKYVVKEDKIVCYLGIVRSTYKIKDVVEITHFKKSDKLVVYFDNSNYTVIVIKPTLYDKFILAVRDKNKRIVYDTKIDGEELPQ